MRGVLHAVELESDDVMCGVCCMRAELASNDVVCGVCCMRVV